MITNYTAAEKKAILKWLRAHETLFTKAAASPMTVRRLANEVADEKGADDARRKEFKVEAIEAIRHSLLFVKHSIKKLTAN
jgi:hypothetical protein